MGGEFGPFESDFERGYVPCDEPPGMTERDYARWKASGGTVKKQNPRTAKEWQEAVNAADFALLVDSARQYGLITGGPPFNLDRCQEILDEGAKRGFRPQRLAWWPK